MSWSRAYSEPTAGWRESNFFISKPLAPRHPVFHSAVVSPGWDAGSRVSRRGSRFPPGVAVTSLAGRAAPLGGLLAEGSGGGSGPLAPRPRRSGAGTPRAGGGPTLRGSAPRKIRLGSSGLGPRRWRGERRGGSSQHQV